MRWTERLAVLALLAAPVAFFAWTIGNYFAWGDEAQFVDPAASAHFGQGFTSMAWPYQNSSEFFAGNAPGYSLLLIPWIAAIGFGLDSVRCLNLPLALLAGLMLWYGLRNVAPALDRRLKALALGVCFLGAGVQYSLGSARYDLLGLCVVAGAFLLFSRPVDRTRNIGLVVAGVGVFYAGFHLVAGALILLALLNLQDRRRYLAPSVALSVGILVGLASWLAVMAMHGLASKFFVMLFGSQHTLTGQLGKLVLQHDSGGMLNKVRTFRLLATQDPSLLVVALLLFVLLAWYWRGRTASADAHNDDPDKPIAWLVVDFVVVLPLALFALGKFPIYYSWVAYVPATMLMTVWCSRLDARGIRWAKPACAAVLALATALGVYDRISHRDITPGDPTYANFQAWVRGELTADDMVYADHEAYFAARAVARRVLGPTYGQTVLVPGVPERDGVTALVVQAAHREQVEALIGGRWHDAGQYRPKGNAPGAPKLEYVLLRRSLAN